MSLLQIFIILIIHWIGDFVVQTDEQARNKSSSNWALTSHVLGYTFVWLVAIVAFLILEACAFPVPYTFYTPKVLLFLLITGTTHWIIDYYTSRLNTKLYKSGKIHEFFVSIGFDQILHYIQLFTTYYFLTR